MAITDKITFGMITILEDGQIQLRKDRVIIDIDGVTEIQRIFMRTVLAPGDDVTSYPLRVRAICNIVWTPAVIAAYQAARSVAR